MKHLTVYALFSLLFFVLFFVPQQQIFADSVIAIKTVTEDVSVMLDDLETTQIMLSKNTIVTVLTEQDGWAKISYKTIVGYVPVITLNTAKPELKLVASKNPPFVRNSNDFHATAVGNLYPNSIVEVYAIDKSGWAFVRYGDLTGFVIGNVLTSPVIKTQMVNDANGLSVKQTASPSGNTIGTLANGTKVDVYTTFQDWSYIVTKDLQGYVVASKLKAVPTRSTPVPEKPAPGNSEKHQENTRKVLLRVQNGLH